MDFFLHGSSTQMTTTLNDIASKLTKNRKHSMDNNDGNRSYHSIETGCDATTDDQYYVIDMRSDTLSKPTMEMRRSMAEAEVGDDVYGEDPTCSKLERKAAEILEKEDALFVPSGTMANLLAIMVHCNRRGTEAIVGDLSHAFLYEQGSAAQIAGVQLNTIKNLPDGTFNLEEVERKIRGYDCHEPITKLIIVENTHNMCGGKVLPLEWIENLSKLCKKYSLSLHMDGARVFNAAEALNIPIAKIVKNCDSVCFCLSKGLSCPVGSILVGTKDFIAEARRLRKALGGGMRQVGVLAAPGLVALETIVPRLKEDHLKIQKIAKAIHEARSPNIYIDIDNVLLTNILLIQMKNKILKADMFAKRLTQVQQDEIENGITDCNGRGIILKLSSRDWEYARIVSYQQINEMDIELAINKLKYVIAEFDNWLKSI